MSKVFLVSYYKKCANLNISKKHLLQLDKQLARLLKLAIGLPKWCKHYNLINFLETKLISTAVLTSQLPTLKSAIQGTSQVRHFYRFLLSKHHLFDMHKHNNLICRVKETCNSNEISFLRYLFDDSYVFKCKKKLTNFRCDGIIDSLKYEFAKEYLFIYLFICKIYIAHYSQFNVL